MPTTTLTGSCWRSSLTTDLISYNHSRHSDQLNENVETPETVIVLIEHDPSSLLVFTSSFWFGSWQFYAMLSNLPMPFIVFLPLMYLFINGLLIRKPFVFKGK